MNPPSRQKVLGHGVSMSRHSVLCRDSGARHCVATRLCARDIDSLSRQCGAVLHRNREGNGRTTEKGMPARVRQTRPSTQDM